MSRAVLVVVLIAGCGRVAFDRSSDGGTDDAIGDAPTIVDCTQAGTDGVACDDANICTDESFCQAGACIATVPMTMCTVADSEMDFDNVQGVAGWFYGYWTAQSDPSYEPATDFVEAQWSGSAYETPSTTFTYLSWWGAHPASNPTEYAIRRWISAVQGPAVIDIHVGKSDSSCGDGIEAQLLVDGVVKWTQAVAFDDSVGFDATVPATLTLGLYVELVLGPAGLDSCDSTETSFVVRSP